MTNQEKFIQIFGIDAWQQMIVFSGLAEQFKEYWTSTYNEMSCRDCKEDEECHCDKDRHESGTSQVYSINLKTLIAEVKESAQVFSKYACELERIEAKYAEPKESEKSCSSCDNEYVAENGYKHCKRNDCDYSKSKWTPKQRTRHLILLNNCSNAGYYCPECRKRVVKEGWSETVKTIKFCPNCGVPLEGVAVFRSD